jgi:hypothetical protein
LLKGEETDYVIKFDNPDNYSYYSNQGKLEEFTWELVCKDYPHLKHYFLEVLYCGEYDEGKFYTIMEYVDCSLFNLPKDFILELNRMKSLLEPIFQFKYTDGYQYGNNNGPILYDYAINKFTMAMIPNSEL